VNAAEGLRQRERFFEHWTLKESFTKALGVGLTADVSCFTFDVDREPIALTCEGSVSDHERTAGWRFRLFRPTPEHILAVTSSDGASVHLSELSLAETLQEVG
jgi:4'-phosphopantetheinyl transferase